MGGLNRVSTMAGGLPTDRSVRSFCNLRGCFKARMGAGFRLAEGVRVEVVGPRIAVGAALRLVRVTQRWGLEGRGSGDPDFN
jgi:hypothetical protein